jgi:hypothetical protein
MRRQTSFLPELPAPTTKDRLESLAKAKAIKPGQEPCDFGLFDATPQSEICDLIRMARQ